MEAFTFLSSLRRSQALMRLLGHRQTYLFEYFTVQDTMVIHNKDMTVWRKIEHYLGGDQSIRQGQLRPEDSWQIRELLTGSLHGPMEMRGIRTQGEETVYEVDAVPSEDEAAGRIYLGYIRDITLEKAKEKSLRQQAQRDSLTLLYNNMTGKALIDQYLREKDPYASCGLLVIDVDFFKNVNDRYGHLFGDKVLQELAHLLQTLFSKKDILVRAGGDEFLVFLKDVDHATLLNKTRQLSESVRKIPFSENDYCLTCSIGACFLPENVSGYLYSQLFENADWALYQAKENGRNQYVFCDDLRRYTESTPHVAHLDADGPELDTRYLHNDLISTAFEIFEKTSRFEDAIDLFLKVVGIRLQLDRITILSTNIKERRHTKLFQWLAPKASSALADTVSFTKEDFLTLFQSYDENGIAVLQHDNLSMYSPAAQAQLMQGLHDAALVEHAAVLGVLQRLLGAELRVKRLDLPSALQTALVAALAHDVAVFPQGFALRVGPERQQVHPVAALVVVARQLRGRDEPHAILCGMVIAVLDAEEGIVVRNRHGVQPHPCCHKGQAVDGHRAIGTGRMIVKIAGHRN